MSLFFRKKKYYDINEYNFWFADDDDFTEGYEALLPLPSVAKVIVITKKTVNNSLQEPDIRRLMISMVNQKNDTKSLIELREMFGQIVIERMRDPAVKITHRQENTDGSK